MQDPSEADSLQQLHIVLKHLELSPSDPAIQDIVKRLLYIRLRILALEAAQRLVSETRNPSAE